MLNLKKGNTERKRKGPATNVIDITLVLIPEYQENGLMAWKKNSYKWLYKRGRSSSQKAFNKKHSDTRKDIKKRVASLK